MHRVRSGQSRAGAAAERRAIRGATLGASEKVLRSLAMFGLTLERARAHPGAEHAKLNRDAVRRLLAMRGGVALVTGPSGSGKSTLLGDLVREARSRGREVVVVDPKPLADDARAVADLFACSPERTMWHLARAGLGEARVLAREARRLSESERWRLAFALARARARDGSVIVADEFLSTLDRPTAMRLACAVGRCQSPGHTPGEGTRAEQEAFDQGGTQGAHALVWPQSRPNQWHGARGEGARGVISSAEVSTRVRTPPRGGGAPILVCATAHEDIEGALGPEVIVRVTCAHVGPAVEERGEDE